MEINQIFLERRRENDYSPKCLKKLTVLLVSLFLIFVLGVMLWIKILRNRGLKELLYGDISYVVYRVTINEKKNRGSGLRDFRDVAHLHCGCMMTSPESVSHHSYGLKIHRLNEESKDHRAD